jgi:hypothetical protein
MQRAHVEREHFRAAGLGVRDEARGVLGVQRLDRPAWGEGISRLDAEGEAGADVERGQLRRLAVEPGRRRVAAEEGHLPGLRARDAGGREHETEDRRRRGQPARHGITSFEPRITM